MKRLNVDKGLLRETEVVQDQIRALLKCDLLSTDVENEISLTAFRLLTRDLLDLYNVENEAVMNVLSHYFECSRPDAERSIRIYKKFCSQTDQAVQYLSVARQYEHATRLEIPKLKHAPTSLAKSLQEYLDDKDFEVNRRQYFAEQEAKRTGKPIQKPSQPKSEPVSTSAPTTSTATQSKPTEAATSSQPPKGPAPDLIDFFESIEQNQQPMAQNEPAFQQQQTGFYEQQQQPFGFQQAPQQIGFQQDPNGINGFAANDTNPFLQTQQQQQQPQPMQTQFTGAGLGGYGQQPQQQFMPGNAFGPEQQTYASPMQAQSPAQFQVPQQTQQQATNPFRQSVMPSGGAPVNLNPAIQRQPTNPFARNTNTPPMAGNAFAQQAQQAQQQQQQGPYSPQQQQQWQTPFSPQQPQQSQPLQSQPTGTNPFTRNLAPSQQSTPPPTNLLQVQPTGSTNPFRQTVFVDQQTGQGWQQSPQATMGGFENMDTIPVFPRPGQTTGQ